MGSRRVNLIRSRATDSGVYKVARTLSGGGYEVVLLLWDRSGRVMDEANRTYTIRRVRLPAPTDRLEVIPYLPLFWVYEFAFLLKRRARFYHACDLDTLLPAVLAARITGARLHYTIYDFYASNIPLNRLGWFGRVARRIVSSIENRGIGFADVVYLADESRRGEIEGAHTKRTVILYNTPEDMYRKLEETALKSRDQFVVFYAGLLLRNVRGIEYMIDVIQEIEGASLVLAGSGPDEAFFRKLAQQSKRIRFLGWIPKYEDVIQEEMKADVLFRFSDPSAPKTIYESPNKLFEAMMCAKPIIVNTEMAASKIVIEEACGIAVPFGDRRAIRDAVSLLSTDNSLREELGRNGRRAYEQKYGWALMNQRLLASYREQPPETCKP